MKITPEILKEIGFVLVDDHSNKQKGTYLGCGEYRLTLSKKENFTIFIFSLIESEGGSDIQFVLNETGEDDGNHNYNVETIAELLKAINTASIRYGKKLKHKSVLKFIKTEEIKEHCEITGSKHEKSHIKYMLEREGL